jgi:hypothetical protein
MTPVAIRHYVRSVEKGAGVITIIKQSWIVSPRHNLDNDQNLLSSCPIYRRYNRLISLSHRRYGGLGCRECSGRAGQIYTSCTER